MQQAASVREAADRFGIARHHLYRMIREGLVTPRAVGRRSIVIFSELEAALKQLPATRRPNHHRRVAA